MSSLPDDIAGASLPVEDSRVLAAAEGAGFDAAAFRAEVAAFCRQTMAGPLGEKARKHQYFSKEDRITWQRALQARGWFAAHWPRDQGGQDWSHLQRFILLEELEAAGGPWLAHFGISFVGPVLWEYGTTEQCERFLDPIRASTTWWCQGFSEPGAGSDLASLSTRAVREGNVYRVTGQKTWTTMAHWADMIFCLVRTHETDRPQQGISFLLIDLESPGVTVRPTDTIDGCHHINEVFFDDVQVPAENLVGREGDGWAIARFIVNRERLLVTEIGKARRGIETLKSLAANVCEAGRPLSQSIGFRRQLAALELQYETVRATAYSAVLDAESGREDPAAASLLKIRGCELQQGIMDLAAEVAGRLGLAFQKEALHGDSTGHVHGFDGLAGLVHEHLHSRSISIYGGSNEIQRGILSKTVMGG